MSSSGPTLAPASATSSSTPDGVDIDIFTAAAKGDFKRLREIFEERKAEKKKKEKHRRSPTSDLIPTPSETPLKNNVLHIYVAHASSPIPTRLSLFSTICGVFRRDSNRHRHRSREILPGDIVPDILDWCPQMLFLSNKAGEIPLHIAARNGDNEIVEALLHWPKSRHRGGQHLVEDMLKKTNGEGDTALHLAARFNEWEVVKILSRAGPNVSYSPNHSGRTPIFLAAERGHLLSLRAMLEFSSSLNYQGPEERTALHAAVMFGGVKALEMMDILLQKEKTLAQKKDAQGWTPLHFAAYVGHPQIASRLLHCHRTLAYEVDNDDRKTAVHVAALKGHIDILNSIIESCPDACEVFDKRGRTILHYAVDGKGNTFRKVLAVVQKHSWMSHILFNAKDSAGNCAIHHLLKTDFKSFDISLIKLLSNSRIDWMAVNNDNLTVVDVIDNGDSSSKKSDILSVLKKRGSRPSKAGIERIENGARILELERDAEKETANVFVIVSTLIATCSFAACLSAPGGYHSWDASAADQGQVVLAGSPSLVSFYVLIVLAMACSSSFLLSHLIRLIRASPSRKGFAIHHAMFLLLSLLAMVSAFFFSMYAVLGNHRWVATVLVVLGCVFFAVCSVFFSAAP